MGGLGRLCIQSSAFPPTSLPCPLFSLFQASKLQTFLSFPEAVMSGVGVAGLLLGAFPLIILA